jgi:hypothetical protein
MNQPKVEKWMVRIIGWTIKNWTKKLPHMLESLGQSCLFLSVQKHFKQGWRKQHSGDPIVCKKLAKFSRIINDRIGNDDLEYVKKEETLIWNKRNVFS